MMYEVRYQRADGTCWERHVEAPAHRKGKLPTGMLAPLVHIGMAAGAETLTIHAWQPLTLARDGTVLHVESAYEITQHPIPCSLAHREAMLASLNDEVRVR